jgi:hypothetical protein
MAGSMMLYSKNGSIPKPQTDNTDGWIEVPEPPTAADGQEVVWWFPPGWVVRPVKPADEAGFVWNWSQSSESWVKSEAPIIDPTVEPLQTVTLDAATAGIVLSSFTAGETII